MKITYRQGRECLRLMREFAEEGIGVIRISDRSKSAYHVLRRIGWCDRYNEPECWFIYNHNYSGYNLSEVLTALAMCAAIAGVEP